MKSEHRHELKTNELAEWIANFPEWAKKNLKTIIYVSVVVAAVAGAYTVKWYNKNIEGLNRRVELTGYIAGLPMQKLQILQSQVQGFDTSYNLLQPAEGLEAVAGKLKNDHAAALALIKRGDILRMELHYRFGDVATPAITARIEQVKSSYLEAAEKAGNNSTLAAMAKLGLGLCEEELGNFDAAKQIYSEITANEDFQGTTSAAQAKQRLETMDDYRKKLVFKAPVKPKESLSPAIQMQAPDGNPPVK